mgnify:CR=1 FL=1
MVDMGMDLLTVKDFLEERCIFEETVWKYALYHADSLSTMKEAFELMRRGNGTYLMSTLGTHFKSKLVTIEARNSVEEDGFTKHLEYHPMINTRAHSVGQEGGQQILNRTFRETYDKFLASMLQKDLLTDEDKMTFVYYLQLQDMIDDAYALFKTIPAIGEG